MLYTSSYYSLPLLQSLNRLQLSDKTVSNINKSSTGSTKKGKRKSIAGMAKVSSITGLLLNHVWIFYAFPQTPFPYPPYLFYSLWSCKYFGIHSLIT